MAEGTTPPLFPSFPVMTTPSQASSSVLVRRESSLSYEDESRDEQSSYHNLTERVLLSMPNHQLWETAKEDERYGEWQEAYRGARKAMGIGRDNNENQLGYDYATYDTENNSKTVPFPPPLLPPPRHHESTIVFTASTTAATTTNSPDIKHNEEREGIQLEQQQEEEEPQ